MASISIAAYTVRVRHKRAKEFEIFDSFDGKTFFGDVLDRFLKHLAKDHAHDLATQSLQRLRDIKHDNDVRSAIIEAGEYGYGAEIIDVESKKRSYERLPGEAEMYPFYLLASIARPRDVGVILFQRHGTKGIYTAFRTELERWFDNEYPDYTLVFKRLVPPEVMKALLNGKLRSIEITSYSVPKEETDKIPFLGNVQDVGFVTRRYVAKKNKFLSKAGWLKHVMGGKAQVIEVTDTIGDLGDRVLIEVEFAGTTRKVDLARPESIAPYIDCTDQMKFGDDGHPTRESIDKYASGLLAELLKQLGHKG